MIASVGCSIAGSSTVSTRTSWVPCQATAFMTPRLPDRRTAYALGVREPARMHSPQAMKFVLVALGAAVATAVELLEATAIVLAVAATRRPRDALWGAAAGAAACALLAAAVGPVLAGLPLDALHVAI